MNLMQNKMGVEVKYLQGDLEHAEYMYSTVRELLKRHLSRTGQDLYLPSEDDKNEFETERLLELTFHFLVQKEGIGLKLEKMPF